MKRITLLSAIIALVIIGSVFAQQGRWHAKQAMSGKANFCDRIPDLTDEQRAKIEDLRLKFQEVRAPERIKMQKMRLELKELMIAKNPNQKAIDTKIDEIGKKRTEMQKQHVAHRLEIRNLLTDKQKAVFDTLPRRAGKRSCQSRGMRGQRGMGW
ncbi:Spy/CpxP family protein refolding chaperone [candidate division KSB1 bacterium]|nr:Spy/CpxP family protein refolding chaperone [candidate division KSB1 bacterium]